VTNEGSAPVGLGRVVLNVSYTGLTAATALDAVAVQEIVGGVGNDLDANVAGGDVNLFWAKNNEDAVANPVNGGGGAASDSDSLVISWPIANTITGGSSKTYLVRAVINGIEAGGDSVTVGFDRGDESTAVTGGTVTGKTASTKYVYAAADATSGLVIATATEFADTDTAARNIIWSDKSDNNSNHPTVDPADGTVTTVTGSADWTNGYKLGLPTTQSSRSKS
jgi:hypothetical protein